MDAKIVRNMIRRFEAPDETRTFERGRFEVVTIGGMVIGRASYEPGWKWSEHVGPSTGSATCEVAHVGLVVSGRGKVRMENGIELTLTPGDLFAVEPGHDSWVEGDEPYVSLHFLGADHYTQ